MTRARTAVEAQPVEGWIRRAVVEVTAAVAFLTRARLRPSAASGQTTGAGAFGVVGAALGALGAVPLLGLGERAPLAAGALALAAIAVASGALHFDGLADTADALAAPSPAASERARKDPAVGAAGVLAIALTVIVDVGLLATMAARPSSDAKIAGPILAALACIVAAAISRVLPVVAVALPAARRAPSESEAGTGVGAWFSASTGRWSALVASGSALGIALAVSMALDQPALVVGAAGGIVIGVALARWLVAVRTRLDGDAFGAIVEIGFAAVLVVTTLAL